VLRKNNVKEHIVHLQRLHLRCLWHFALCMPVCNTLCFLRFFFFLTDERAVYVFENHVTTLGIYWGPCLGVGWVLFEEVLESFLSA